MTSGETFTQQLATFEAKHALPEVMPRQLEWETLRAAVEKSVAIELGKLEEAQSFQSQDSWRAIGQCLGSKRLAMKTGTAIEQAPASELYVPSRLAGLNDERVLGGRARCWPVFWWPRASPPNRRSRASAS